MKAFALGMLLALLPNSDGQWWQDARYEASTVTAGQGDWECEFEAYGDPVR